MLNSVQNMAAKAAVRAMLGKGYISICAVDKILSMTGGIPSRADYDVLHLLHCVNFRDMEPELLRGLPVILDRVLASEGLDIEFSDDVKLRLVK